MDVYLPFKKNFTEPVLKLSAEINGEKQELTITVRQGEGFEEAVTDVGKYPFSSIVKGSAEKDNKGGKDTDSVQVAVRWSNQGAEVGHATNAMPSGQQRDFGATWDLVGAEGPNQSAIWKTDIAPRATHLEVIVVYTDVIYGPGDLNGDLPIIIGSFTADLHCKSWIIKSNPEDVFQPRIAEPAHRNFGPILEQTQEILRAKTGYELVARPEDLSPNNKFIDNNRIIDKAFESKPPKINTTVDTGYDIVPR